ncbi:MAG: rod shape-determining protein RodA, partial [Betaproteobacteria bacterium HGW-Betaproteobacteria-6]
MIDIVGTLRRGGRELIAHIDFPLLLITMAIMGVGLATVNSATWDSSHRMVSQAGNMGIAMVVMWFVSRLPPQKLMNFAIPLYVIGLVLLVGVFLFGIKVNGARRWLPLGFVRIQPSEIMKIAMPLMLAWYFHKYEAVLKMKHYAIASLLLLIPFAMIAKQPDLGTALLVGAVGFYVIFFAGLPWKIIIGLIVAGAAAAPLLWNALHDYQQKRILTLIDPTTDPLGTGYHIIQSIIAIGSGGTFGKGYLNGTQTHLEFIPEKHTDFIFAVYSEEWGL